MYQHVEFVAGTYALTFAMAYRELVGNSWGYALEVVVTSGDLTIIEKLPTDDAFDKDWTTLVLQFTIPTDGGGTVYLRMHGTGYGFFDDVSLVQLLCHPDVETVLSVVDVMDDADGTSVPPRPLVFNFPFREADALLCGYCTAGNGELQGDAATFPADNDVCIRCKDAGHTPSGVDSEGGEGPPTVMPAVLCSFEEGDPNPFSTGGGGFSEHVQMDSAAAGGSTNPGSTAGRGLELHGTYYDAHAANGLLEDWSKYDYLKVNVYNPASQPTPFYVEIRDVHSVGYWSRVNWYTAAAPGHSTIAVPLQIFVGEKTVTKERRRLYLQKITRLVFSIESPNVVVLDNVRLEPATPYKSTFPQLIKLDFGPPTSPVQLGFVPVIGGDWYRSRVGYGIEPGSVLSHIKDRRHPTNLLRDWIGFKSGGIAIDLPNGKYTVTVYMEDPGYWEYFPSWTKRQIVAETDIVVNQTQTYETFLDRYFRHESDADVPGVDAFKKYVGGVRYTPLEFDVDVADGQLNVHFISEDVYACAVQAVVIFPTAKKELGHSFLAELMDAQKEEFDNEYVQAIYTPTGSAAATSDSESQADESPEESVAAATDFGLDLFSRHPETFVRAFDAFDSNTDTNLWDHGLSATFAVGETSPTTFAVKFHAGAPGAPSANDVAGTTTVTAFSVQGVNNAAVEVFAVRNKIMRLTEGVYTAQPLLLDPVDELLPFDVPRGQSRRFWLLLTAHTAGCHHGSVNITFASGATLSIPLSVSVEDVVLENVPAEVEVGFLGLTPVVPSTPFPETSEILRLQGAAASVKLLHKLGVTGISGGLGGPIFRGYDSSTGDAIVDFADADATMELVSQHWPAEQQQHPMLNSYGDMFLRGISHTSTTWNPASLADVHGKPYATALHDVLAAIAAHAEATSLGWRPIYHNIGDEPSDETALVVLEVAAAFKDTGVVPTPLTSVFTSITSNSSVKLQFADDIDLIILNHHTEEAILALKARNPNVKWMLYNQASRYRVGFYVWRLMELGGSGHYQFMLSSPGADPYYSLDAREDDYCALFLRHDGSVRTTVGSGSTEQLRAALLDLRYGVSLDAAIAAATTAIAGSSGGGGDALVQALAEANQLKEHMRTMMPIGNEGHGKKNDDPPALVLDEWRRNVSRAVLKLHGSADVVDDVCHAHDANNAARHAEYIPGDGCACQGEQHSRQRGFRFSYT